MAKLVYVNVERIANKRYFCIIGYDGQGREYIHHHKFDFYSQAEKLVLRIDKAGHMIDIKHWQVRAPYGSEAWLLDGEEDRLIEDEKYW